MVAWDQWRMVLEVFRHGSYARAAKALRIDPTTVSRHVKLLERELGYELFVTGHEGLGPTARCEALLADIESASDALRAAEQKSAVSETGTIWRELRMTAPPFLITHLFAPAIPELTYGRRIRVELMGTASRVMLTRREADIAIRIEDRPEDFKSAFARIEASRIGALNYAIYCADGQDADALPWAGLIEQDVRTSGSRVMMEFAGAEGFRYQVYHFSALHELVASGAARAMLPRFLAEADSRLKRVTDTVLTQPLWMLYHRQDEDSPHLKASRCWIVRLAQSRL
ncbi:MAG: LysR family transcriptional regulator [Dichotomicrobium sp.]